MRRARIALVSAVVLLLASAHHFGLLARFRELDRARETLLALGPWGYAAFVLAYTLLQPFGVPGTIFILVAPLIWPWPVAFALSLAGTMAASMVGFGFARFVARDWVASRLPERVRVYERALAERAFATVFLLRLVFWMPPWLHAFFGVSRVSFGTHFWASLLGYLLPLFLVSYFGQALFDAMRKVPPAGWVAMAAVVLAGAVIALRRRSTAASPAR